jgi:hypothetical protein
MNLRHIDPRSSDWKDAMMEEGDEDRPTARRRQTPAAGSQTLSASANGSGNSGMQDGSPPGISDPKP